MACSISLEKFSCDLNFMNNYHIISEFLNLQEYSLPSVKLIVILYLRDFFHRATHSRILAKIKFSRNISKFMVYTYTFEDCHILHPEGHIEQ